MLTPLPPPPSRQAPRGVETDTPSGGGLAPCVSDAVIATKPTQSGLEVFMHHQYYADLTKVAPVYWGVLPLVRVASHRQSIVMRQGCVADVRLRCHYTHTTTGSTTKAGHHACHHQAYS